MIEGVFIAESLRIGSTLEGVPLIVRRITRTTPANASPDQPSQWTLIEFEAEDAYVESLAGMLAEALDEPGWYADFRSSTETFVVFPGRVFRYVRGDQPGREQAAAYGRSLGIPETQLDWPE